MHSYITVTSTSATTIAETNYAQGGHSITVEMLALIETCTNTFIKDGDPPRMPVARTREKMKLNKAYQGIRRENDCQIDNVSEERLVLN